MNIKKVLLKFPALYQLVRGMYMRFLQRQIAAPLLGKKSVFFVQVGSNDGVRGDPIHELIATNPHWKGIFIEPVSFLFESLKRNYHNEERFIFENVGVGAEASFATFYYVSEKARTGLGEALPSWHDQVGSFNREHILRELGTQVEPYIVEQQVKCDLLEHIIERNRVATIDLLHIDTEGYDFQVLSQFDFKKHRPAVVLYEHMHLAPEELKGAKALLRREGYRVRQYDNDTLAVLQSSETV